MKTRIEIAKDLSKELGVQVKAHPGCYSVWDGVKRWFPLYTVKDVRRMVKKRLKGRSGGPSRGNRVLNYPYDSVATANSRKDYGNSFID